jgi:carbon storage regulator
MISRRPDRPNEQEVAMLVLARRKSESVVLNNNITITVLEIRGDKVRLAITAPRGVQVHRQEVFDAIHGVFGGHREPVAFDPAPALGDDLLPDLILECRLAPQSPIRAQFTSEGGFFLRKDPPER